MTFTSELTDSVKMSGALFLAVARAEHMFPRLQPAFGMVFCQVNDLPTIPFAVRLTFA